MINTDLDFLKYKFSNDLDNARESINEGLLLRSEFLKQFPVSKIKAMKIDQYVIGKDYSFCYWLEQKLDKLGRIKGGSPADKKFGVYYGKTKNDSTRTYRHIPKWGTNYTDAFKNIHAEIQSLLNAGKKFDLESIEKNRLSPLFKGKILSIYYPEKYLSIFSLAHIEHFIESLGIIYDYNIIKTVEVKKQLLLNFKYNDAYLKTLTNYEFSYFLYTGLTPPVNNKNSHIPDIFNESYVSINNVKPEVINLLIEKNAADDNGSQQKNYTHKVSPDFENKIKRIGSRGELIVFNYEKELLIKQSKPECANLVKDVSGENKGYDILSYNPDGTEKYIEVKSTVSKPPEINFYITENELRKARDLPGYLIYLIFEVNTGKPKIFIFNPFKQSEEYYKLNPVLYNVKINSK